MQARSVPYRAKPYVAQFLKAVTVILCNETIEQYAIAFRKQRTAKLPDAIIAATALFAHLDLFDPRQSTAAEISG